MFENTLLIVKSGYMTRRKCLVLHLLKKGFQIQARKKLVFKPEDAAQFYRDLEADKCYMLYVILLSKGTSEAIILTKQNAVQDLTDNLICFFGTSNEMEGNVHASRSIADARREITFIFPNYIHEPFDYFDKQMFYKEPILEPLLRETCNMIQNRTEDENDEWRVQLSEWLLKKNPNFPEIVNQCSFNPVLALQDKGQQTDERKTCKHHAKPKERKKDDQHDVFSTTSTLTGATSDLMTTSSCITCSSFKSTEGFTEKQQLIEFEKRLKMRATRTMEDECPPLVEVGIPVCECPEYVTIFESTSTSEEERMLLKTAPPPLDDYVIAKEIPCTYSEEDVGPKEAPAQQGDEQQLADVVSEGRHSKEDLIPAEEALEEDKEEMENEEEGAEEQAFEAEKADVAVEELEPATATATEANVEPVEAAAPEPAEPQPAEAAPEETKAAEE